MRARVMAARASEKPLVTEYTSRSSLIEHCLTSEKLQSGNRLELSYFWSHILNRVERVRYKEGWRREVVVPAKACCDTKETCCKTWIEKKELLQEKWEVRFLETTC